jgi:hypothetical protein
MILLMSDQPGMYLLEFAYTHICDLGDSTRFYIVYVLFARYRVSRYLLANGTGGPKIERQENFIRSQKQSIPKESKPSMSITNANSVTQNHDRVRGLTNAVLEIVEVQKATNEDLKNLCNRIDVLTSLLVNGQKKNSPTNSILPSKENWPTTVFGLIVLALVVMALILKSS